MVVSVSAWPIMFRISFTSTFLVLFSHALPWVLFPGRAPTGRFSLLFWAFSVLGAMRFRSWLSRIYYSCYSESHCVHCHGGRSRLRREASSDRKGHNSIAYVHLVIDLVNLAVLGSSFIVRTTIPTPPWTFALSTSETLLIILA